MATDSGQVTEATSSLRYVSAKTIREYAKERLTKKHDETEIREAHATFFCQLAERAEPMVRGYDHDLWFPRLMAEHDNFHSALQ